MVNDKMVNGFMEKRLYMSPLMEVATISLSKCLLDGSPVVDPHPVPPVGPGAPKRTPDMF